MLCWERCFYLLHSQKNRRVLGLLDDTVSNAENRMFYDRSEIFRKGNTSVFYGEVGMKVHSHVEEEVLIGAKESAKNSS